ncbi:DUF1311 domain-containing protein [Pseudomonas fluorescens]|nr:DUF1311 domain-containing protein [Pseudomonas fluorescens]
MKRSILVVSIIYSVFLSSAFASGRYSAEYGICIDKSGGVTDDMVDCSNEELGRQDTRLNQAYKTAMSVLPTGQKGKLQEAQRLWVKFRDADCSIYYSLTGGTMDMLNGSDCELSITKERADSLVWISENG